ncbi:bhcB [Scenedesmus sp. PABB004]|nr:bhcB [Scenedesmus sp. PABB004]
MDLDSEVTADMEEQLEGLEGLEDTEDEMGGDAQQQQQQQQRQPAARDSEPGSTADADDSRRSRGASPDVSSDGGLDDLRLTARQRARMEKQQGLADDVQWHEMGLPAELAYTYRGRDKKAASQLTEEEWLKRQEAAERRRLRILRDKREAEETVKAKIRKAVTVKFRGKLGEGAGSATEGEPGRAEQAPLRPGWARVRQHAGGATIAWHAGAHPLSFPMAVQAGAGPPDPVELSLQPPDGGGGPWAVPELSRGSFALGCALALQQQPSGEQLRCVDGSGWAVGCLQLADVLSALADAGHGGDDAAALQQQLAAGCWRAVVRSIRRGAGAPPEQLGGVVVLSLSDAQLSRPLVTCSTGNHALAFMHACTVSAAAAAADSTIYLPTTASEAKVSKLRRLGARVVQHGADCVLAEAEARRVAAEAGGTYVSPYNDWEVMAGQGGVAVELLQQLRGRRLDVAIVPVGGGGLIGGVAAVLKAAAPGCLVVGAQPAASDVMARCVAAGRILDDAPDSDTLSDATAGGIEQGAITLQPCVAHVDRWLELARTGPQALRSRRSLRLAPQSTRQRSAGAPGCPRTPAPPPPAGRRRAAPAIEPRVAAEVQGRSPRRGAAAQVTSRARDGRAPPEAAKGTFTAATDNNNGGLLVNFAKWDMHVGVQTFNTQADADKAAAAGHKAMTAKIGELFKGRELSLAEKEDALAAARTAALAVLKAIIKGAAMSAGAAAAGGGEPAQPRGLQLVAPNELARAAVAAHERCARHGVRRTPLLEAAWLSAVGGGGCEALLKLESEQHTNSFKARGAVNKVSKLRRLGARVVQHGADCVLAEAEARRVAAEAGGTYVSPYNDWEVMAGQGGVAVELLQQLRGRRLDVAIVPVGGGGLIGGVAAVLKAAAPGCLVVGAQPAASDVMARCVAAGRILDDAPVSDTLSDATAGGIEQGAITLQPCVAHVDRWVSVSEQDIADAMLSLLHHESKLVEGAAGCALAAFRALAEAGELHGKRVAVVCCGGNVSPAVLARVLAEGRVGGPCAPPSRVLSVGGLTAVPCALSRRGSAVRASMRRPESPTEERGLLDAIADIKAHGAYPDVLPPHLQLPDLQGRLADTLGWVRHALEDPDDFSSAAIGRMVSKEYGRHERPHTERHAWLSSPPGSPAAAAARGPGQHDEPPPQQPQQAQQQAHQQAQQGGWTSPPCGPGFLRPREPDAK